MNIAHSHSGGVAGPIIAVPIVATPIASAAGVPPSLAASLGGVTQGSGILTSASLTPSVSASSGLVAPHSLAPPTGSVSSGGGVPVVSVAGGATVHGGVSHSAAHTGAGSTATHAQAPPLAAAPHLNIAQQQQQQPAAAAAAAGSSSSAANPSSSQVLYVREIAKSCEDTKCKGTCFLPNTNGVVNHQRSSQADVRLSVRTTGLKLFSCFGACVLPEL